MAYLIARPSGSVQIRESVRTANGPRSRTLASFRGPLTERILDDAARRASRPLEREALIERAKRLGVGFESATGSAARQLVAGLRGASRLDPALVGLLRERLAELEAEPLDDALREAAEWLGRSDAERGATLRGLLRLGDAIVRSRVVQPARRALAYPRIASRPREAAG